MCRPHPRLPAPVRRCSPPLPLPQLSATSSQHRHPSSGTCLRPTQQQDLGARAAETGKEITHRGRGLTQRWGLDAVRMRRGESPASPVKPSDPD